MGFSVISKAGVLIEGRKDGKQVEQTDVSEPGFLLKSLSTKDFCIILKPLPAVILSQYNSITVPAV